MIAEVAKYSAGPVWASSSGFVAINRAGARSASKPTVRLSRPSWQTSFLPSLQQTRQQALSRSRLLHTSRPLESIASYMMPSKPLAAKASVFNCNFVDDVALTVARILQRFFQNAGLLLSRHRGLEECIWASFGPALKEARQKRCSCASSRGEWCPLRRWASHVSGLWGCRSWRRRSWGHRAAHGDF